MGELTLFKSGNQLPAHLRRGELSETAKALMGGSTSKRISIEGGSFRMIVGGKEVAVNEERAMNIVIVRAAEHNSRTFYEGTYQKGVKAKPACWSDDSITPAKEVKNPQSSTCANCPQHIKGSGSTPDSRACRFQRRIAVVLENDTQGDIYAMSIPAASVFAQGEGRKMGLQQYGKFLGSHGVDVTAVVTEMRFDTASTAPKLVFSAVRPLEEDEWETVQQRGNEPAALDAVTMTVSQLDDAPAAAPAPAAPPAPSKSPFTVTKAAAPAPAPAPAVEEPTVRETPKQAAQASVPNVGSILSAWGDDSDD